MAPLNGTETKAARLEAMQIRHVLSLAVAPLSLAACATVAPVAGSEVAYRAVGTEPFWSVTIQDGRMNYDSAEGTRFSVPAPAPRTSFNGHRYETARLTVDVTHGQCSDGMSDRVYPDTVSVIADGRALRGCGGEAAAPASLAGTNWIIAEIDGAGVSGDAYSIHFTDDRISGKAGCNQFSGTYALNGSTITTAPLAVTRMACPGPRMEHERRVLALLTGPVEIVHRPGEKLVLTGRAGSIALRRAH